MFDSGSRAAWWGQRSCEAVYDIMIYPAPHLRMRTAAVEGHRNGVGRLALAGLGLAQSGLGLMYRVRFGSRYGLLLVGTGSPPPPPLHYQHQSPPT